jgi:medium-chain acyl-[acyl-carrier-protein] hydrolase
MTDSLANPAAKRWVVRRQPRSAPKLRMFCFPYAGGSASAYHMWPDDLPASVDLCAIQLPGRESRIAETPQRTIAAVMPAIAVALRPLLDIPAIFFGHSMGGLLAFELAREFRRSGYPEPACLLISGRQAPQLPNREPPIHEMPTPDFLRAIRKLEGIPAEVFEDEQLLELVLPTLRADFALIESYVYEPGTPLNMPISVFYGRDDIAVFRTDAAAWQEQTTSRFTLHDLPGGHFFFRTAHRQLLSEITTDLQPLLQDQ